MNRSGARIAGSRSQHSDGMPRAANLLFVEISKYLKGKILEGQSGPMKEFQHMQFVRQCFERSNGRIIKGFVSTMANGT